jgi:hypothetical protein
MNFFIFFLLISKIIKLFYYDFWIFIDLLIFNILKFEIDIRRIGDFFEFRRGR